MGGPTSLGGAGSKRGRAGGWVGGGRGWVAGVGMVTGVGRRRRQRRLGTLSIESSGRDSTTVSPMYVYAPFLISKREVSVMCHLPKPSSGPSHENLFGPHVRRKLTLHYPNRRPPDVKSDSKSNFINLPRVRRVPTRVPPKAQAHVLHYISKLSSLVLAFLALIGPFA
ncbi:hypothetical protein TIFTF001_010571 [Ficus carica]|uniref:Uncharacterized protein n=1 Tax=Ficus carica TaxID=3494 RepID=A0AA88D3H9_FICCA|nr:hypothetical protein TIFTF001_010571 [Ficus carica]